MYLYICSERGVSSFWFLEFVHAPTKCIRIVSFYHRVCHQGKWQAGKNGRGKKIPDSAEDMDAHNITPHHARSVAQYEACLARGTETTALPQPPELPSPPGLPESAVAQVKSAPKLPPPAPRNPPPTVGLPPGPTPAPPPNCPNQADLKAVLVILGDMKSKVDAMDAKVDMIQLVVDRVEHEQEDIQSRLCRLVEAQDEMCKIGRDEQERFNKIDAKLDGLRTHMLMVASVTKLGPGQ